jgi:hypothetical protein
VPLGSWTVSVTTSSVGAPDSLGAAATAASVLEEELVLVSVAEAVVEVVIALLL